MKIKLPSLLYILMATVFVFGAVLTRSAATPRPQSPSGLPNGQANGGIATLYVADPLLRTFCFEDGGAGHVFLNHQVFNRCSDIAFNYEPESLTVGIEGARVGTIVDLGDPAELAQRYDYGDGWAKGQGYASLRVQDGKVLIAKGRDSQAVQDLKESALLFQEGKKAASAPVKLGNVYLARITDRSDKSTQIVIKFVVIGYTPNQSVTIRWQLL
jgi:hypothetical protein